MKILITGASGYIGSELALRLADKGFTVHALLRSNNAEKYLRHPLIRLFKGDLLDKESISHAISGCQQVYHTAALVRRSSRDHYQFYLNNLKGTENILEQALKHGVKKLVFTSTCGVWGATGNFVFTEDDPRIAPYDNDYELSKILAEKLVKEYGFKGLYTVIVNPSRVYGPGIDRYSNALNRHINKWLTNRIIALPWRTSASSNYAYISDVVDGHILAMERGLGGECYILGGENVSFYELFKTVSGFLKQRKFFIRIPQWILHGWALCVSLKSKIENTDPSVTMKMVSCFSHNSRYSSQKAIRQLGYQITPFKDGILQTINHLNK